MDTISSNIPNEFICPITMEIMKDPVIAEDGYTYERNVITRIDNSLSPMTRQPINIRNLIPNRAIKESIERFIEVNTNANEHLITVNTEPINKQLVIPQYDTEIFETRSPYNDKLYKITKKNKPNTWTDHRVSTTLVAVLDTSGSMGESCSLADELEQDGFSRLNLVQHSMNTVISMLDPGDELVVIQFNSTSQYLFNETINQHNKIRATSIINSLTPGGGTTVWNGLRLAYDAVANSKNNNIHIMLLTDGQSNDDPYSELKRYMERSGNEKNKNVKLTTFGFSCDINSKSLFDIAEYTHAGFNFIPDASMVGTSFCNYLANILAPDLFITSVEEIKSSNDIKTFCDLNSDIQYELLRYHCYDILKNVCIKATNYKYLKDDIINIVTSFKEFIDQVYIHNNSPLIENMLKDFDSDEENQKQITKAISNEEWFRKWGYHYLLSLSSAHLTRQCHNFRDVGVQLYVTPLIQELQDKVYDIFSKTPAPKPYLRHTATPASMSTYVSRSGACFGPNCRIKLADGSMIPLHELKGNELVFGGNKIKYIIVTMIPSGKTSMCQIGDLIISDYHPLYHNKSQGWIFPNQLVQSKNVNIDRMYNIVLESGHYVEIENYCCVTLGHNLKQFDSSNSILQHDYYGTSEVVKDIEQYKNINKINSNIIVFNDNVVYRDIRTDRVVSIINRDEILVN